MTESLLDGSAAANATSRATAAAEAPTPTPPPPPPPPQPTPPVVLLRPSQRKSPSRPAKLFRTVRSAFRSFPILPTHSSCRLPSPSNLLLLHHHHHHHHPHHHRRHDGHIHGAARTTGTLFGHRKARITLALQDTPRSVPLLLVELGTPTAKFIQEMGASGLLRVALECEKKAGGGGDKTRLLDEPVWTATINGKSIGYAAKKEPSESDLKVMQLLHAVSMGAGVLPPDMTDPADGELTYMRAYFDRVVGSKDSETFYMLNPDGNNGPELTVFFVRI